MNDLFILMKIESLNKLFYKTQILTTMGNILYLIAVILVIIWAISFFGGYATGGIIHILLVIAIIVILLRIIRGNA